MANSSLLSAMYPVGEDKHAMVPVYGLCQWGWASVSVILAESAGICHAIRASSSLRNNKIRTSQWVLKMDQCQTTTMYPACEDKSAMVRYCPDWVSRLPKRSCSEFGSVSVILASAGPCHAFRPSSNLRNKICTSKWVLKMDKWQTPLFAVNHDHASRLWR